MTEPNDKACGKPLINNLDPPAVWRESSPSVITTQTVEVQVHITNVCLAELSLSKTMDPETDFYSHFSVADPLYATSR